MKISLGSWAFSFGPFADNPVPFEKTVKRLSDAGYDGIEICGFPPHITVDQYPTTEARRDLVRFLKDHKLGVSGYAADFTSVNPVIEGNKQRYLDLFWRNVEMCVDIGSPSIWVDSIAAPGSIDDRDYNAAFHRLANVWRDAAGIAQKSGIRMVWEFEPGFSFNKPSEVLNMHQEVAHPNFWLLFDTSHAYMCAVVAARQHGPRDILLGGVEEFLKKLKGRIGAIHLIDSDGTLHGDETSTHRPFGEGHIDFEHLAPKLLETPNIEWWCIDMCFWAGSWELVESSLQFVKNLLSAHAMVG
jgi:sugar phosphate isomerase/epimerase